MGPVTYCTYSLHHAFLDRCFLGCCRSQTSSTGCPFHPCATICSSAVCSAAYSAVCSASSAVCSAVCCSSAVRRPLRPCWMGWLLHQQPRRGSALQEAILEREIDIYVEFRQSHESDWPGKAEPILL